MSGSGLRFNGIYGTPNKTQQKLHFATILDVVVNTGIVLYGTATPTALLALGASKLGIFA
jgi:hypothetical protein